MGAKAEVAFARLSQEVMLKPDCSCAVALCTAAKLIRVVTSANWQAQKAGPSKGDSSKQDVVIFLAAIMQDEGSEDCGPLERLSKADLCAFWFATACVCIYIYIYVFGCVYQGPKKAFDFTCNPKGGVTRKEIPPSMDDFPGLIVGLQGHHCPR